MGDPTREQVAEAIHAAGLSTLASGTAADAVMELLAEAPQPTPDDELDELQRTVTEELDGAYAAQSTHWSISLLVRQRQAITDLRGRLAVRRHLQELREMRAAEAPQPKVLRRSTTEHPDPEGEVSFLTICGGLVQVPPGTPIAVIEDTETDRG